MRAIGNTLRALGSRKKLTAGLAMLLLVLLVGILSGQICDWIGHGQNPISVGFGPRFAHSSWTTPLGTDEYGRDILALTVTGLWTSLKVGFYAGVLSTLIGVPLPSLRPTSGGVMDSTLRTVTDTFLVIPALPCSSPSLGSPRTSLCSTSPLSWRCSAGPAPPGPIRSQVLSLRTRGFVDLAKVTKLNTFEIIFEELVPNMLPFIALGLALSAVGAIFGLIALEIIGLGPTNLIDLGLLINSAISSGALTLGAWPLFVGPIVAIVLLFGSLNLIIIGLDEVFNPRLRRVAGV